MSKPITAIIVDDEPDAIDFLKDILSEINHIEVVATAEEVNSGVEAIIEHKPEIVFLDIDMPGKNGFDLINEINELKLGTTIIFTTAFRKYAVDAFEKAAFGYLMKPIQKEKLRALINRYQADKPSLAAQSTKHKFTTFKGFILIVEDEIIGCKADGNYTDIILTSGKTETVVAQIGKIQEVLQGDQFIRTHRSSLININYLHAFERKSNQVVLSLKDFECSFKVAREKVGELENFLNE